MSIFQSIDFSQLVGTTKTSNPLTIDEQHLKSFAFATYLDEEYVDLSISKNNALGPELVDGFLLLSLLTYFSFDKPFLELKGAYALNYGVNRVRFTSPVFVGEKVFVSRTATKAKTVSPTRIRLEETIEMKRAPNEELVMVAEWITYVIDGAEEEGK